MTVVLLIAIPCVGDESHLESVADVLLFTQVGTKGREGFSLRLPFKVSNAARSCINRNTRCHA